MVYNQPSFAWFVVKKAQRALLTRSLCEALLTKQSLVNLIGFQPIIGSKATLCFITLRCATLKFAALRSSLLRKALLRFAAYRYALLRIATLVALRFATQFHSATLRYAPFLCFATLRSNRYALLRNNSLRCAALIYATQRYAQYATLSYYTQGLEGPGV